MANRPSPVDDDFEEDAGPEGADQVDAVDQGSAAGPPAAAQPPRAAIPILDRVGIDTSRFSGGDWAAFGIAALALLFTLFTLLWMLFCALRYKGGA